MPAVRTRTEKRERAASADRRLDTRLQRLDEPPARSYLGVHCPGCGCDTIPLPDGICAWCDRVIALWDGTAIHDQDEAA